MNVFGMVVIVSRARASSKSKYASTRSANLSSVVLYVLNVVLCLCLFVVEDVRMCLSVLNEV